MCCHHTPHLDHRKQKMAVLSSSLKVYGHGSLFVLATGRPALNSGTPQIPDMSNQKPAPDALTFEQAMARLDEIVSGLETDRQPLAEMVANYEEGITLLKNCRQQIESVRQRVELINTQSDTSQATLSPFAGDTASTRAEEPAAKPRRRKADSDDEDISLF